MEHKFFFKTFLAAVTSRTVKAVNVWLTVLLRYEGTKPALLTCRVIHSCVITVIYTKSNLANNPS